MKDIGLREQELGLIRDVFTAFPSVEHVLLYGSRAKGTHRPASDIDLALVGIEDVLEVQAIAEALDELPLPYTFDVSALALLGHDGLRDHIARVGIPIYVRSATGV